MQTVRIVAFQQREAGASLENDMGCTRACAFMHLCARTHTRGLPHSARIQPCRQTSWLD